MKIYADFNGVRKNPKNSDECYLDLTGYGTLASLSLHKLKLVDGITINLSDPDGLEVEAKIYFDEHTVSENNTSSGWFAKFKCSSIKECSNLILNSDEHLCFECRKNLKPFLRKVGQQYKENCPNCGTSIMTPMLPPPQKTEPE